MPVTLQGIYCAISGFENKDNNNFVFSAPSQKKVTKLNRAVIYIQQLLLWSQEIT